MGIESALVMGIGAGVQAQAAKRNSQATEVALNAQSQINQNNAQVAEWQAQDAERRGQVAASVTLMKNRSFKGTQRARLAANGVDLGQGSAVDILTDTDYFGQVDAGTVLDNAAREAWGYRTQAQNFQTESSLLKSRANAENPDMAFGTSLVSSATRMSPAWYANERNRRNS